MLSLGGVFDGRDGFHPKIPSGRPARSGDQGDPATVYQALQEKGYNPVNQIVGYILSEDPTYITNHNNARALIRKIDRDELLQTLVKYYLTH